ncbi:thermonuclease family protein [Sphingomonas parva]|uniref:thermonuclease family protein n=1 Tax=Sphingomonas parva TaxID=2555898 RepID=UPI001CDC0142|nr:hypothetical protein [Sphingomonas parva]
MTSRIWRRARERMGLKAIAGGAVVGAAIGFVAVNALGHLRPERYDVAAGRAFRCTVLSVYDGDGPINCAETDLRGRPIAVRLRGIEAREYDDSCQHPELCPTASGAAAKAILVGLATGRLDCVSYGPSFKRVDARCANAAGADLSCAMLKSGTAVRWARFDPDGRLKGCVPPSGVRAERVNGPAGDAGADAL